jgi:hypothetical protein
MTGAGLVGVTLISLVIWLLLAGLGDEVGAAGFWLVAVVGGVGVVLAQILLVTLLALGSLRGMMDEETHAHPTTG